MEVARNSTPPLLANIGQWERMLAIDEDRTFILNGIKNGFSLVDEDCDIKMIRDVHVSNSSSATKASMRPRVESPVT